MDPEKQRQHDGAVEADIERLPVDLLAHILSLLSPFRDLSMYVRRHPPHLAAVLCYKFVTWTRSAALLPCRADVRAGGVSRRWRWAVERSLASRRRLSFAGQRTGDDTAARLVRAAVNLRDLDM
jgi:hypothetical protein